MDALEVLKHELAARDLIGNAVEQFVFLSSLIQVAVCGGGGSFVTQLLKDPSKFVGARLLL